MSAWRREALSLLPECREIVEESETAMAMWIELHLRFDDAVSAKDWNIVNRLLQFADWCVSDSSGPLPNETSTAAAVAFYEHLPQNRSYWRHFPEWFTRQQFAALLPVFSYHLDEQEVSELKRAHADAP